MWYSVGTCDVTSGSAALVGVGTAWLDAVQPGWAFFGPDGRPYEVLTVNSNTSITLAKNYAGSTLTGQAYDLIPTQGFVRTLAQRVSDLIATYAGFVTTRLAGLFGAGSVSAPGVAREGDTNTGLYWPADDALAATVGGVEAWRVTSAQNFGLGVPSPVVKFDMGTPSGGRFRVDTSNPAEIIGTASNYAGSLFSTLIFDAAAHSLRIGGTEAISVNPSRNAGFGTSTPAARVHIDTTTGGSGLIVGQLNQTGSQVNIGIGYRTAGLPFIGTNTASNPLEMGTRSAAPTIFVTSDIGRMRLDASGNWILHNPPSTPPTLATNGDLTLNPTSNTNLRFSYRGTDGVTRVGNIPLTP